MTRMDIDYALECVRQECEQIEVYTTLKDYIEDLEQEGKALEKMRLAMEKEKERLSDYHEYADGTVDQPFLTPETIK